MSETPTIPVADPKTDQVKQNANDRLTSGQIVQDFKAWEQATTPYEYRSHLTLPDQVLYQDFTRWEKEVSEPPRFERWNLENEEGASEALWAPEDLEQPAKAIERTEEARHPMTRAEEIEQSLFYLNDSQLLEYSLGMTKATVTMRHLP